jgi:hypothetical protein
MNPNRLTIRRLDPPSPDAERRLRRAQDGGRAERVQARRAGRAQREIEFLAAGPAGYPFSQR